MRLMDELEIAFVTMMFNHNPDFKFDLKKLPDLQVEDYNDGGMGSLYFPSANPKESRRLGKDIAQCVFMDLDGTPVLATLSLDNFGELYELDVWKADFSELISLATSVSQLNFGPFAGEC